MTGVVGILMPSSVSREQIQITSVEVFATERYSVSVDDPATPFCFLDDQETGFLPM